MFHYCNKGKHNGDLYLIKRFQNLAESDPLRPRASVLSSTSRERLREIQSFTGSRESFPFVRSNHALRSTDAPDASQVSSSKPSRGRTSSRPRPASSPSTASSAPRSRAAGTRPRSTRASRLQSTGVHSSSVGTELRERRDDAPDPSSSTQVRPAGDPRPAALWCPGGKVQGPRHDAASALDSL